VKHYWCICSDCEHEWIATFGVEHGLLFAADKEGDECPECGSSDVEATSEYCGGGE
jgi:hypothetical protein